MTVKLRQNVCEIFSRNKLLFGEDYLNIIRTKHVAVFGLGGVGGYALDSLARSGIENFTLVDFDAVTPSNINRQIIALHSTIGVKKTNAFIERLRDINPDIKLNIYTEFYTTDLNSKIFANKIDYIVDAIDSMKSKIGLLKFAYKNNIPVITSLGAGNRKDPTQFFIADISEIIRINDKFCKTVLKELKKDNITSGIKAVYSTEIPVKPQQDENGKIKIASVPFVPPVAGYYMSYTVITDLVRTKII